jgi:uncharacterized protein with gpF-like domain
MTPNPKPKTVRPVRANAGLRARYRRRLTALIDEMQASVSYWLTAAYRAAPPRVAELAEDATPSDQMQSEVQRLFEQWMKRFEDAAPGTAESFMISQFSTTDAAMRMALKDAGWTVKFTMTPAMRDAFNACLSENVGLIKSIPSAYFEKIQGLTARSFANGRNLQMFTEGIKALYPVTANRAVLIARDQTNKATAVITRTRQLELGLKEALWVHSGGGKTPRPSHVRANGERYKIAEGCVIDGVPIQPGELINCRCVSRPILPYVTA